MRPGLLPPDTENSAPNVIKCAQNNMREIPDARHGRLANHVQVHRIPDTGFRVVPSTRQCFRGSAAGGSSVVELEQWSKQHAGVSPKEAGGILPAFPIGRVLTLTHDRPFLFCLFFFFFLPQRRFDQVSRMLRQVGLCAGRVTQPSTHGC